MELGNRHWLDRQYLQPAGENLRDADVLRLSRTESARSSPRLRADWHPAAGRADELRTAL